MKYSKLFATKTTAQSTKIPLSGQKRNEASGFAWNVDVWTQLDRFLILGSESGTYYIGEQRLTVQNAKNVIKAIKEDGQRAVARIVEISQAGRAPKNDPAVFALALAASFGDDATRSSAFRALPLVCRTATHLFAFCEATKGHRGWGRGMRTAVSRWYNTQSPEDLTYSLVKYQSRGGWSNRDLLRLSHPVPASESHRALYKWSVDGDLEANLGAETQLLGAVLSLRSMANANETARAAAVIREFRIPREAVPTELLGEAEVWEALLADMPVTAMLRNLGNMSKVGLLRQDGWVSRLVGAADSAPVDKVVQMLRDRERLRKARIHPITVLAAMVTYSQGHGVKGSGSWTPVTRIVDALDEAFYAAIDQVRPTNRHYVLGLDVSGSMDGTRVAGIAGLDCRKATGAMALILGSTEDSVTYLAFDTSVYPLTISRKRRLDDVVSLLGRTGGGGTDCSAPIHYAMKKKIAADVFVILTDSETWYGSQHPAQAMADYRRKMGIPSKLVVVAMASNRSSIGDPEDPLTLNVCGFDTSVPQVIAEFASA